MFLPHTVADLDGAHDGPHDGAQFSDEVGCFFSASMKRDCYHGSLSSSGLLPGSGRL